MYDDTRILEYFKLRTQAEYCTIICNFPFSEYIDISW